MPFPLSRACRPCSSTSSISSLLWSSPPFRPITRPFHSTAPLPRISYKIAVSSSGKGRRFHPIKNAYDFNPAHKPLGLAPHDPNPVTRRSARPDSGEDAFFVASIGGNAKPSSESESGVAFAVADGVGGWTESRVDPADFSHALCSYMASSALSYSPSLPSDPTPNPNPPTNASTYLRPKSLLEKGYDQVLANTSIQAGSSTASVGVALPSGRVELANLGDSGSVLLRLGAVHHYSLPQTHGFNTPYQLSVIPPKMRAQASIFGGAFLEDFPRDAAVTDVRMQHGDVLILATDGVFDNLNNQDILKIVTSRMVLAGAWSAVPEAGIGVGADLEALTAKEGLRALLSSNPKSGGTREVQKAPTLQALVAASIAGEAKIASLDYRRDGPFAKEAQRYFPGEYYRGGKVDDICVLVVVAVEEGK